MSLFELFLVLSPIILLLSAMGLWFLAAWTRRAAAGAEYAWIWAFAWIVFFLSLLATLTLWTAGIGLIAFFASLVVAFMAASQLRMTERRRFLVTLSTAIEKGLPIGEVARAFSQDEGTAVRLAAASLAANVERGMPLAAAVNASMLRLPLEAQLAISSPTNDQALGRALAATLSESRRTDRIWQAITGNWLYVTVVVAVMSFVLTFVMLRIVPEYIQIFGGFDLELPAVTKLLIITVYKFVGASSVLLLIGLGWTAVGLAAYAILTISNVVTWEPPLIRWLWKRRHSSAVLGALSAAVGAGQSLTYALEELAEVYPRPHLRRLLSKAADRAAQGSDVAEALRSAGFVSRSEAGVLRAAERVGNLEWALMEISRTTVRRLYGRAAAALDIAGPVVVVFLGVIVMFINVALFLPLVSLIAAQAE